MRWLNPQRARPCWTPRPQPTHVRQQAKDAMLAVDPHAKTKDSDYVFIDSSRINCRTVSSGLSNAVMIAAALGSKAGELNALGTTTTIDLWRHFRPLAAHDEARNVRVAKWFTAFFWGAVAIAFALFAGFSENLIVKPSTLSGSIFYGQRGAGEFLSGGVHFS